ncbi:MAG TPA: DUF3524 domain-containing protein [Phycisphaerales bacterium]|nr:DUF3524 domain-containing protein [Phycisphaerales bacterium]HRQ75264.1 DUF3524 domain-containing protein [Phycisphaerales bacterium]
MSQRLRILAFEPFDAGSHRAVRESVSRHSRHDWVWITRPGRNWKWRMRLAAVEMTHEAVERGLLNQPWDAVFCTSLMSAADLRALLPARFAAMPLVLYMHENQAAYPVGMTENVVAERDAHFALTNLTSVLAADHIVWNSEWNKRSFMDAMAALLHHGSDAKLPDWITQIERRSEVIWPPVELPPSSLGPAESTQPTLVDGTGNGRVLHNSVRVVWPHRWEHDKGPGELLELAEQWSEKLNLRWVILGERYRATPPELDKFAERFGSRIDHMGYLPNRDAYWQMLQSCDWVLSTANHEFFGVAVAEALLAGCLPWLPQRLSYPELLPAAARGLSPMNPPDDPEAVRNAIRGHLERAIAPEAVSRLDHGLESAQRKHGVAADSD